MFNIHKLQLFFFSVKYTNYDQLMFRLWYTCKRKFLCKIVSKKQRQNLSKKPLKNLSRSDYQLSSKLPIRRHLAKLQKNRIGIKFLNHTEFFSSDLHDINWRPKHLQNGTRLWLLNLHYHEFLEGLPFEVAKGIILNWIDTVHPYVEKYWLDTWNSYSLSIRVVVWIDLITRNEDQLLDVEKRIIYESLNAQLDFLTNNLEKDIGGNHLIKNIKALLWAGRFFHGADASIWFELGQKLLLEQLDVQILTDGMHYELSPAYHNQVLADLLDCYLALDPGEVRELLRSKLEQMAGVCKDFEHPDGTVAMFNDTGLNYTFSPGSVLSAHESITGDSVTYNSRIQLPFAGYYGLRSNDELFLLDCGKLAPDNLPAHGHGDALSFEWTVAGNRIFVDTGVYEYSAGNKRSYSRSTRAHNTVSLDELDQSEFWSSFRVGRRARIIELDYLSLSDGFILKGAHDGYSRLKGCPIHIRKFKVKPGYVHITDEILDGAGQAAEGHFVLHPNVSVAATTGNNLILNCGDTKLLFETRGCVKVSDAVWYPDQGISITTKKITIHYGSAPVIGEVKIRANHGV